MKLQDFQMKLKIPSYRNILELSEISLRNLYKIPIVYNNYNIQMEYQDLT